MDAKSSAFLVLVIVRFFGSCFVVDAKIRVRATYFFADFATVNGLSWPFGVVVVDVDWFTCQHS